MDPLTPAATQHTAKQLQNRAIARARRDGLRMRTRRIRRFVTGVACALFAAAFLGIYVQLASGNDPALVAAAKRASASTAVSAGTSGSNAKASATAAADAERRAAAASSSSTEPAGRAGASSGESASSSRGEAASASPSAVITSQS